MRLAAVILGVAVMTVGCVRGPTLNVTKPSDPSGASLREKLIGRWYGEQTTKDGGKRSEIAELCPDGTVTFQFHLFEKSGNVRDQMEVGLWGVSGSIFFTIIRGWLHGDRLRRADPTDANLYDAYWIQELNEHTFRYKSVPSGDVFVTSRAPEPPTCPGRSSLARSRYDFDRWRTRGSLVEETSFAADGAIAPSQVIGGRIT